MMMYKHLLWWGAWFELDSKCRLPDRRPPIAADLWANIEGHEEHSSPQAAVAAWPSCPTFDRTRQRTQHKSNPISFAARISRQHSWLLDQCRQNRHHGANDRTPIHGLLSCQFDCFPLITPCSVWSPYTRLSHGLMRPAPATIALSIKLVSAQVKGTIVTAQLHQRLKRIY